VQLNEANSPNISTTAQGQYQQNIERHEYSSIILVIYSKELNLPLQTPLTLLLHQATLVMTSQLAALYEAGSSD